MYIKNLKEIFINKLLLIGSMLKKNKTIWLYWNIKALFIQNSEKN